MKIAKYGWIPSHPSINDLWFTPPVMADLPASVDMRNSMPPVYNQGEIGSCTAQALAGVLQYEEIKQDKPDKSTPSRLFIYYNERVLQNTPNSDSGASMRTGLQAISQYGFCEETLWPYDANKWRNKPNNQAYRKAFLGRITNYARLNQNLDQLKTVLAAGLPFVFGFTAYQSFESAEVAQSGQLPMPKSGDQVIGGHAVCAVGYEDNNFLIRNSWGNSWGLGGYFKMPIDYILSSSLAADFWVINAIP